MPRVGWQEGLGAYETRFRSEPEPSYENARTRSSEEQDAEVDTPDPVQSPVAAAASSESPDA
jgi:hypothetical protein